MRWEVAIVGGGPAGLASALFLAHRAPHLASRIVVLEKARHPREKICAGAVGDRAERLLRAAGAHLEVPSCLVRGFAVSTAHGLLSVRSEAVVGRVVRRKSYDAALAARVRQAGVTLLEGASVRGLTLAHDLASIRLDDETIDARVVVGADGVGSTVRRAAGFARGTLMAQVVEVDTETAPGDREDDVLHFDLRDGALRGYGWDFPTPLEGAVRRCRGLYDLRRTDDATDANDAGPGRVDLADRLRSRLDGQETLGPTRRFSERGIEWHAPLARPRLLLAGEAAGIDPVLGEGIAQAIQYGSAVADYLIPRLATDRLRFDDWKSFLRRTRLGVDFGLRTAAIPLVYGGGRAALERWVSESHALGRAGLAYFGGVPVSRFDLLRALGDATMALGAEGRSRLEAVSRRSARPR